jgi:hypothetical protein
LPSRLVLCDTNLPSKMEIWRKTIKFRAESFDSIMRLSAEKTFATSPARYEAIFRAARPEIRLTRVLFMLGRVHFTSLLCSRTVANVARHFSFVSFLQRRARLSCLCTAIQLSRGVTNRKKLPEQKA